MRLRDLAVLLLLVPVLAVAASTPAEQPAATPPQTKAADAPQVVRAMFTSGVRNREPVNSILSLGNNEDRIYYFTELRGLEGQVVTHRWLHGGAVVAEVHFKVKGPRWRVWSSKRLMPGQLGVWEVQVLDGKGEVIGDSHFTYTRVEPAGSPNTGH